MTREAIEAELGGWLAERIGAPVARDASFVEALDSFQVVELVTFCEDTFGMRFTASDMQSADFRTLAGLAGIVAKRASEPGAR